jgi:hypothetical protein
MNDKIYYSHEESVYSTVWTPNGALYSVDRWKRLSVESSEDVYILQVDCNAEISGYYATTRRDVIDEYVNAITNGVKVNKPDSFSYDMYNEIDNKFWDISTVIEPLFNK